MQIIMYDCIVLLTRILNDDGTLCDEAKRRIEGAAKAFHEFHCPVIIAGGSSPRSRSLLSESSMHKVYMIQLGVPEDVIFIEEDSHDTAGQVILSRIIVQNHRWQNLLFVSSDYHVYRVSSIIECVYGKKYDVQGVVWNVEFQKAQEVQSVEIFKSTFVGVPAGSDLFVARLLTKHNWYNNDDMLKQKYASYF